MYIKTDDESFVRDGSSGAVLNNNSVAFNAYRRQREEAKKASQLRADVDELKQDINEIRELLKLIAERVQ